MNWPTPCRRRSRASRRSAELARNRRGEGEGEADELHRDERFARDGSSEDRGDEHSEPRYVRVTGSVFIEGDSGGHGDIQRLDVRGHRDGVPVGRERIQFG